MCVCVGWCVDNRLRTGCIRRAGHTGITENPGMELRERVQVRQLVQAPKSKTSIVGAGLNARSIFWGSGQNSMASPLCYRFLCT